MTIAELRRHEEYKKSMEKVRNYSKGFKFTLNYAKIPIAKANALKVIMGDCIENNLIKSISMGFAIDGTQTSETFVRI